MTVLSNRQFATIKRVAQNVNPLVNKKNKLINKINDLNSEINDLIKEIEGHEMGVKSFTGGYTSEDLVIKVVEETGKTDKNGNPIRITKYEPNLQKLEYDANSKCYIIKDEDILFDNNESIIDSLEEEYKNTTEDTNN